MTTLFLAQAAQLTEGKLLQGNPEILVSSYTFDSRNVVPGALFFALKDKRDGHEFVRDAYQKGAVAACVSQRVPGLPPDFGLILVNNTLDALHKLAEKILRQTSLKVVAITGSIGKTSTKEFTARLLSEKFKVLKSPGNFNNQIGVPITILSLNTSDQIAVLEMGMSQPGEIKKLTQIAPPDVAVITGIAPVHLEFFKDMKEIALAKREILEGARNGALAVLNGDDLMVREIASNYSKGRIIFFGLNQDCLVRAENLKHHGYQGISFDLILAKQKTNLRLPFLNQALVSNLLAACAVSLAFGLNLEEISGALSNLPQTEHRGQLLEFKNGIKVYDDSYNSNPVALAAVLKSLGQIPARRKIAILGDMLELGPGELDFHLEVGKKIPESGWSILVTVGERAKYLAKGAVQNGFDSAHIYSFSEVPEVNDWLINFIQPGDFLLIKGSRGLALERIITFLRKEMEV